MTREQVLRHPAYWFEYEQNELFRQVTSYMKNEGINQTQLAERLKVSKGYVSQILNGNFNYTLKKWIELCLAIGIVPGEYRKIEDVIKEDNEFALSKKVFLEQKTEIQSKTEMTHFKPYTMNGNLNGYLDSDSRVVPNNSRITITGESQKVA